MQDGRSVPGGFRGRAASDCEAGRAAAGREKTEDGTGAVGAASGPAGGSDGGGGKAGGSGSCGRTERDAGAWGPACLALPGRCGVGLRGAGCGR